MPTAIKDECAIVGIGQTEFSENSGRSELQLAAECVKTAIADAGLEPTDIWLAIVLAHFTRASLSILRFRGGAA